MKGLPLVASATAFFGVCLLGACTASPPETLARSEESSTVLAPVTTAPSATTAAPSTDVVTMPPTIESARELSPIESTIVEDSELPNLVTIGADLKSVLGPSGDVRAAVAQFVSFPSGPSTPADAVITEVSIGIATPTEQGTVLAQVAITFTTSLDSATAFDQQASAVLAVGMYPIDSTGDSTDRSASFRQPGGDQFDEFVVTSRPSGDGSVVRLAATSELVTGGLSRFIDWADGESPLPDDGEQSTLVVVRSSGEDRLAVTNLTVESSVLRLETSPQREATRLVRQLVESERFSFGGDPDADQALSGVIGFEGLDQLLYEVEAAFKTVVDPEGELVEEEAVIIRLRGQLTLAD